jgi:hypothetical protein
VTEFFSFYFFQIRQKQTFVCGNALHISQIADKQNTPSGAESALSARRGRLDLASGLTQREQGRRLRSVADGQTNAGSLKMRIDLARFFTRLLNSIVKRLPSPIRNVVVRRRLWRRVRSQPFNRQEARREMVERIIPLCGIVRFVETGTYVGNTTEYFAKFNLPVITAESDPVHAALAAERLRPWQNVQLRTYDSVRALRELAQEPIDRAAPTLFYLDAHWHEYLPLRDELEIALGQFANAVVLIDDFQVPDDPGYGFDSYGPGKTLNLDYLLAAKAPPLAVYFPSVPSQQETGARRGCVVVTASSALAAILDRLELLRRWHA